MSNTKKIALALIALLVALRLALPEILKNTVNKTLHELRDYDGSVQGVSLSLLKGSLSFYAIRIVKKPGDNTVFAARRLDVDWSWRHLLSRAFVGSLRLYSPQFHVIFPETPSKVAAQKTQQAAEKIPQLPPFKITRLQIIDGKLDYEDNIRGHRLQIAIDSLQANASNITNSEKLGSGVADFFLQGRVLQSGQFKFNLKLNQFAALPEFKFENETSLPLKALNNAMREYLKFDVAQGIFRLAVEIAAEGGGFHGYVKPTIDDLDVMNWKKDKDKPAGVIARKVVVGSVAEVFKNHWAERLGTKIPIAGKFEDPKVGVWRAIVNLLKNAFVEALAPGVEGSVRSHL